MAPIQNVAPKINKMASKINKMVPIQNLAPKINKMEPIQCLPQCTQYSPDSLGQPLHPSTAQQSPVQPSTAKYSPVQPRTAHYSQGQPNTAQNSPSQYSKFTLKIYETIQKEELFEYRYYNINRIASHRDCFRLLDCFKVQLLFVRI